MENDGSTCGVIPFAALSARSDTARVRLFSQGFSPEDVFTHPQHEAAQKALPDLILQLRAAVHRFGLRTTLELI